MQWKSMSISQQCVGNTKNRSPLYTISGVRIAWYSMDAPALQLNVGKKLSLLTA
jgi:hypothetical protein